MFFRAFVMAFAAAFMQTFAVLIDNVVVCTFLGETEIAAVALASPFFYALEIPAAGLAAGLQVVCAKDLGAGKIELVEQKFNQLFFLAIGVLSVLTIIVFCCVPQLTVLFGARGNTAALQPFAAQYLYGLSFEIIPYVLFCILTPVVLLDNGGKFISIASACGCAADILLDLLSVRFGWGLLGIGIATSASAVVYFLITMLHFLDKNRVIRLHFVRAQLGDLKEVFIDSAPKAFRALADMLRSLLFIFLVSATGGVVGTCVLSIHGTIAYAITILASGVAGAVGIMAGICFGERNIDELEGTSVLAHRYDVVLSACAIAVLAVCLRPLSAALTDTNDAEVLLQFAILCVIIQIPFSILVSARISYLAAVEQVKEAQWMGTTAELILPSAAACLLAIPFGVRGIFLAFPTSGILTLVLSWLLHVRQTGRFLPPEKSYLKVDDSFEVLPGDVIAYPIRTLEECALASEQVILFCRGHRISDAKGRQAGLCVEELTTNVIEHGRGARHTDLTIDIRIVIDQGDIIIRSRDNGRPFNLKTYADLLAAGDHSKAGPGIRILLNSAKNISHYRTYGMNTTILRI